MQSKLVLALHLASARNKDIIDVMRQNRRKVKGRQLSGICKQHPTRPQYGC